MDPFFHGISVALYSTDEVATVWTFSQLPNVERRIQQIRDRIVLLGGFDPITLTNNQVKSPCGQIHRRATKFLMSQAVEKDPDVGTSDGDFLVKDLRSGLMLSVESNENDQNVVYFPRATGQAPNVANRLRAITAGFVRYGEMDHVEGGGTTFKCGQRHDELVRLLLPFARNVQNVEDMLEAEAMRGQMTTGTLGFTPPT